MTWCIERSITSAGWTTIFHRLVVRKTAFSTHTGVVDVVPFAMLSTGNAFDLVIGQRRINEKMTIMLSMKWLRLPVLPFHKTQYAPRQSLGKVPRPHTCLVRLNTGQRSVNSIAPFGKRPAPKALEVVEQIPTGSDELGSLLYVFAF